MKKFSKKTLLISLFLFASLTNIAQAKVYEWTLAESWSKDQTELRSAAKLMAEYASDLSGGRLKITTLSSDEHQQSNDIFSLIKTGKFQMGHSRSSYWQEQDINTLFFTSVPFGMIAPEMQAWFYQGGGLELMKQVYSKHNMLAFPGGSSDLQMGGWFSKPVESVQDLQNLRMQISGLPKEILQALGVKAVELEKDKQYEAFVSKQIDAIDPEGPLSDQNLRFADIATHYYTGWHQPSAEKQFLINLKAYNALPQDLQYVLTTAMRLAAYDTYTQARHKNSMRLAELRKKHPNLKIQAFPSDVVRALKNETTQKIKSLSASNQLSKEILNSMFAYQEQIRLWTRIGDQAYLNNLAL